jgi:hypothetical protein
MEREGDRIKFDESEQQSGPKILENMESMPISEAPQIFEEICRRKTIYGRKLQDMAITEAYDDQTAVLLVNAKTRLMLRHRKLERMTEQLIEIAGIEIIEDALATPRT